MEDPPLISGEKFTYGCKKCGHRSIRIRYWTEYGYRSLNCESCASGYFVDGTRDPVFKLIDQLSRRRYAENKAKPLFGKESEIIWFEHEFEKACDPCACGGKLEFAKADIDLKCPGCKSSGLKILRSNKKYAAGELELKWVTHKLWGAQNGRGKRGHT